MSVLSLMRTLCAEQFSTGQQALWSASSLALGRNRMSEVFEMVTEIKFQKVGLEQCFNWG